MAETRDIELTIRLKGGHEQKVRLRQDAPELRAIFSALAVPQAPDRFVQLPLDGGRSACSMHTSQIVSVRSTPPVVVDAAEPPQPQQPARHTRVFRPRFAIIDDFLFPREHDELLAFALVAEERFRAGTVTSYESDYRQNLVIAGFGESAHARLLQNRLLIWFPLLAKVLEEPFFPLAMVESQLTATGEGQFFKVHADNGPDIPRALSCIYYLHQEPRGFAGGSLRLYDCIEEDATRRPAETFTEVDPLPNRMVVFPSSEYHEVMPVRCPSGAFADYRFAVTTWLHRGRKPAPEERFGWGHFRCGTVAPQLACDDAGGEQER